MRLEKKTSASIIISYFSCWFLCLHVLLLLLLFFFSVFNKSAHRAQYRLFTLPGAETLKDQYILVAKQMVIAHSRTKKKIKQQQHCIPNHIIFYTESLNGFCVTFKSVFRMDRNRQSTRWIWIGQTHFSWFFFYFLSRSSFTPLVFVSCFVLCARVKIHKWNFFLSVAPAPLLSRVFFFSLLFFHCRFVTPFMGEQYWNTTHRQWSDLIIEIVHKHFGWNSKNDLLCAL